MRKKLLFVSNIPPFKSFAAEEAEIFFNTFNKKFDVSILFWKNKLYNEKNKFLKDKLNEYKYFSLEIKKQKYGKFLKFLSIFFPLNIFNPYGNEIDADIKKYIIKEKIDYIFLYDYQSLFAFRNLKFKNKIIFSLSPSIYEKLRFYIQKRSILSKIIIGSLKKIYLFKLENFYKKLIYDGKYIITNKDHELIKFKNHFKKNIIKVPIPHKDLFFKDKKKKKNKKLSIVHVGHMKNVMTKISLDWISKNIIPLIIKRKLEDKIVFNILSAFKPDKEIKDNFSRLNSNFRGFVSNKKYNEILFNSDVLVFAYPFNIKGPVNRVIGALSIPMPIVCTKTVEEDFKVLKNNMHILSSNDPETFLNNVLKVKKDIYLSDRLKKNARKIYLNNFSIKVFNNKMNNFFKRLYA